MTEEPDFHKQPLQVYVDVKKPFSQEPISASNLNFHKNSLRSLLSTAWRVLGIG